MRCGETEGGRERERERGRYLVAVFADWCLLTGGFVLFSVCVGVQRNIGQDTPRLTFESMLVHPNGGLPFVSFYFCLNGAGNVNDETARDSYFHYSFTKGPSFSSYLGYGAGFFFLHWYFWLRPCERLILLSHPRFR